MYYILNTSPLITAYTNKIRTPSVSLIRGILIDQNKEKLPYQISYKDALGNPLHDYDPAKNFMNKRMVSVLRDVGVDNLQTFELEIINEITGEVNHDFLVVNVIGLVSCANVKESKTSPLGSGYYFHKLVINPNKTKGLLMFRLAESLMDIIVHEKVAKAIEQNEFRGITLTPLSESREESN